MPHRRDALSDNRPEEGEAQGYTSLIPLSFINNEVLSAAGLYGAAYNDVSRLMSVIKGYYSPPYEVIKLMCTC